MLFKDVLADILDLPDLWIALISHTSRSTFPCSERRILFVIKMTSYDNQLIKYHLHYFSNQNGRKRKDYPSKPEKNNYLDTSTSFKYGFETGGGYRSAAATPPSTESHHYKSCFLVTITMIIQSLIFATYH